MKSLLKKPKRRSNASTIVVAKPANDRVSFMSLRFQSLPFGYTPPGVGK